MEYSEITPEVFSPVDVYEVKILLAYFLNKIARPVTAAQLMEIATSDNVVNYFLYIEAIQQMVDNGTVAVEEQQGTEVYVLTESGRRGAVDFKSLVNKSVRDRIYAAGLKLFARLRAEQEASFEITETPSGCTVRCVCQDAGMTLLDMTLLAPDREQAEFIRSKIALNPSAFYSKVLDYVIANEEYVPDLSQDED
ncbi:MAG: DUF4364 family protein [Ruminococcus sp.]|nr:DUF4364 family protein [Ruminococcus sp.]